jgi:isopenicillin N synthase-like dioxygenase
MPHACLDDVPGWDAHATAVARAVLGLLSEGLGLAPPTLEEASCLEGKVMICHYYPACPEHKGTMGIAAHTDPGVITVLAQDGVCGLQVKHTDEGSRQWVDMKPVPGALVINVGDHLQVHSDCLLPQVSQLNQLPSLTSNSSFIDESEFSVLPV